MNAPATPVLPAWCCPFCSLLCDGFLPDPARPARLRGSDCPRAQAGLVAHLRTGPAGAADRASIDGEPVAPQAAVAAAAERLARWRQPLFGQLGTDVAGARAAYRLAARCGALCDHADGAALMHGLRALQDRGQFTTTLGELRNRADLLVCVGTPAVARFPEFFRRCGLGEAGSPCRDLVFLGVPMPPVLPAGVAVRALAGSGDLFADLQQLATCLEGRPDRCADAALVALAAQLRAARYAVLVWEAGVLPPQGELLVEALNRIAGVLNRDTRAATLGLGGSDGAQTVNQVFAWLSGLPLRSRIGNDGPQHEPLRFGGERLLATAAVDGLLWVSSFDPDRLPPATSLPRTVLGPPAMAAQLRAADALHDCVFIAVATPGLNAAGHLFRTDGLVVVPLVPARDDGLPGVAEVLAGIEAGLRRGPVQGAEGVR